MLDEHGLGHDGTSADRTVDSSDCRNQMQKKDGEIAHTQSSQDRDRRKKCPRIVNSPCTGIGVIGNRCRFDASPALCGGMLRPPETRL